MNKNNNLYEKYHLLMSLIHYDPGYDIFDKDEFEKLCENEQKLLIFITQQHICQIIEENKINEK